MTTLRQIRESRRLSAAEVAERLRMMEPSFPANTQGFYNLERRGTRDYWYIRAIARVYGMGEEEVAAIARNSAGSCAGSCAEDRPDPSP